MQGKCHQVYDYGNHIISLFSPLGVGPQQQPPLYQADSQAPGTFQANLTSHQSTVTQGKCHQMYGYGNRFTSAFSPLGGPQQQPQLYRAASQTPATIQAHLTSNHCTLMQGKCHQIYDYGNQFISLFSPLGVGPQHQPPL